MISRMERNNSIITSFIESIKQNEEGDNAICFYADAVLTDLINHLEDKTKSFNLLLPLKPTLSFLSVDKLKTQLSQLPAYKRN